MSTIPFKQVVQVIPSVLSAGGAAVDLNGLMLTQHALAPQGQLLTFASSTGVADYFGAGSTEASLANIYFGGYEGCTKKAGSLYMVAYPFAAVSGFLRSASLATMTLVQLKALTGTIILTVGGVVFTSSSINLSSATSFSNAATIIQAAFTTPTFTVTFDSTSSAFIFTTTATGVLATVTYATGTISAALKLTSATGAVLSQGAAAADTSTFMDGVIALTQNFASFMTTTESLLADKILFAAWSASKEDRYVYVAQDSDVNALVSGNTANFGYYLSSNDLDGTIAVYGDATHAAFVMGYAAALDFTRTNGRTTLSFRAQSGLLASVSTEADYTALITNGYNGYGSFGSNNPNNNRLWFFNGSISGQWKWADTFYNQIWLNANLQLAMVNILTSVPSIPYNRTGYGLIYAACLDPINAAINFGAIRTGVTLSESQKAQMQFALGVDVTSAMSANGFYLQIQDAAPATRALRQSPPCTLYYTDGGSIQQLLLASIEVQ